MDLRCFQAEYFGESLIQSWVREVLLYQEYDARSSEPDRDKDGYELGKPLEGKFRRDNYSNFFHLMEVEVFSMLRYCRMSGTDIKRRARKKPNPEKQKKIYSLYIHSMTTYPCSIQVYGDNWLGDGEEVDKRFEFQHKPKLVRGRNELENQQQFDNMVSRSS